MKPFAQMATIGRLHNIHLNIYVAPEETHRDNRQTSNTDK